MSAFDLLQVHLKEGAVSPEHLQAHGLRRHGPPLKASLGEADVTPSNQHAADSRFSPSVTGNTVLRRQTGASPQMDCCLLMEALYIILYLFTQMK